MVAGAAAAIQDDIDALVAHGGAVVVRGPTLSLPQRATEGGARRGAWGALGANIRGAGVTKVRIVVETSAPGERGPCIMVGLALLSRLEADASA